MFCYQCEQTASMYGCTDIGVCGKEDDVAMLQDLLVYQLEGVAFYAQQLLEKGQAVDSQIQWFVIDSLFATLTNVNFDSTRFIAMLKEAQQIKTKLQTELGEVAGEIPAVATYVLPDDPAAIQEDANKINIRPQAEQEPDIQSLKDTLLYGLKGMASYAHQAWMLDYRDDEVSNYVFKGLSLLLDKTLGADALLGELMALGQLNLKCMELLDKANTETYGHPEPTPVLITKKKGPFIVVSGHDYYDLQELLEQTADKGINVYTHGEMLPAHGYPGLRKYPHLVGNYGGPWQLQQREFRDLPGSILMTTNCLINPGVSYTDRLFTTNSVGWLDIPHINQNGGPKDFTPLIEKALELGGWTEDEEEKTILTGFGREAILSNAGTIVDAVKGGQIKHFFLVGGCDGAKPGRNYYSVFADKVPKDSIILTLGCGKYRFNKKDFGTLGGLPRLIDVGQCADAYSAIRVAGALAEAFDCGVNDLPLSLVVSWFEQKAVSILLTLLSLGIKDVYLGPSLPAFITPNVLDILVDKFNINPTSIPEKDMAMMLN
jgi:hydroxylamine reductase